MYQRPFVTSHFAAYAGDSLVRRLSLAISLTDDFTGAAPDGTFQILLRERRAEQRRGQEPIRNNSGFFCFLDVPDGNYTILLEPGSEARVFYLRPEAGNAWSADFTRTVALPRPNPLAPVVPLTLTPNPSYRFPANATLVRGRASRAAGPVAGAVVRASYERATPTTVDPGATATVNVESQTDSRGYYVLFFTAPSPALQNIQVTGIADGQQVMQPATIREKRTTLDVDIAFP
jgi:hypothetical protein